jgi:hypothetical protein
MAGTPAGQHGASALSLRFDGHKVSSKAVGTVDYPPRAVRHLHSPRLGRQRRAPSGTKTRPGNGTRTGYLLPFSSLGTAAIKILVEQLS